MKKILLFLSFLLMSIGVFGTDVTITPTDFTAVEASDYSTTKEGVTVAVTASTVTADQMRIFKGQTITISAESDITEIVFTCTANGTAKYGPGCFNAQDGYTYESSGRHGIWTGSSTSVSFTAALNQVRATQIVVTISGGTTTYTVTYSNGGSATIKDETKYASGTSVTTRKNTFTKDGYVFDCWQLGSRNIDEDSTFVITQNTTLTAKWLTDERVEKFSNNCVWSETWNNTDKGCPSGFDFKCSKTTENDSIFGDNNHAWTFVKAFASKNCIRLGNTGVGGVATTPQISYDGEENLLLTFKIGAWDNDKKTDDNKYVDLSCSGANLNITQVTVFAGEWNVYHVLLTNVSNNFTITWASHESSYNRFFLDSICISETLSPIDIVTWYNDSIFLSKDYFNEINFKADSIRIKPLQAKKKLYEMPDSTLKVNVDLSGSYCDTLHFIVCNSTEAIEQYIKIPYIVESTDLTDAISTDKNCDVVIHKKLSINNNKENRDVTVYPRGVLNITTGKTYTVNSLILRRDNDSVPHLSYKGTLDIKNGMFFEIRSDGSDWRWVVLPDTFNIGEINANVYENGVWSDALVKHYDGAVRANNGSGGWKLTPVNTVFNPGAGFIFGAYMDSETEKRIYRISLDTAILKLENKDKGVQVYPYGKGLNKPANDLGWNVVGNPFMESCNISSSNPIRIGELVKTDTNPWDGKWVVDSMSPEKKVNYIVVKDYHDEYADAGYYKSIPLKVDGHSLEPFTSFFIQVDTALTNPTLLFTKGTGISKAPSRISEENEEIFLRVNVGNKKTGCFVSNKYDDSYEIGYDLESNENIYQSINGYKLLYSAINDSILSSGIKVHTAGGTLSLDNKTDTHRFSEIKALYNNELYDLLNGETVEVNGEFILFGARRQNEVATGFEENYKNLTTHKVIANGILYIIVNDKVYNVLGERVR